MELGLGGKTVIVTGGAGGLGSAICEEFSAEGAAVVINYLSSGSAAATLAHKIEKERGARALAVRADVRRAEDIERMYSQAVEAFGGFDILINNAGTWPLTPAREISDDEWEDTVRVNLTSAFLASKRAVSYFIDSGKKGKIINIVSINSFQGSSGGHAHYAAAKGGLLTFTYSLAREVAEFGITVNAVCPGMMRTAMNEEVLSLHEAEYVSRIPIGRISEPSEVASAVVFLASGRAGYITGSTVNVSGGMMMR